MQFDICPICDKELVHREEKGGSVFCKNGCYETEKWMGFTDHCFISPNLDKIKIPFYLDDREYDSKIGIVDKIVAHWRQDDRYLMIIMDGKYD